MSPHDDSNALLSYDDHAALTDSPLFDAAVLIHGWACDRDDWTPITVDLTRYGRVITVDLPGHGSSAPDPDDVYTAASMARHVLNVMDALGLGRVVVFGHSAGTEVAIALAVEHPDRVAALVMVDPAYGFEPSQRDMISGVIRDLDAEDPLAVAAAYFARVEGANTPPSLAQLHQDTVRRNRPDVLRRMFRDTAVGEGSFHFRPDTDAYLSRRSAPLFAVYRNHDRAGSAEGFKTVTGDRHVVYDRSGHWPHQEQPTRFIADATDWLRSVLPS